MKNGGVRETVARFPLELSGQQGGLANERTGYQADLERLVERSPDIVARFDRELRHLYVNPAVEEPTGISRSGFLGRTHRELGLSDSVVEAWESGLRRVFDSGEEALFEFTLDDHLGPRFFQVRAVPEVDGEESTTVIATAREFTGLRRLESQLEDERLAAEQQAVELRGILDNMAEGVTVRDPSGSVLLRNRAAAEIVGLPITTHPAEPVHLRYSDGSEIPPEEKVSVRLRRGETVTNEEYVFTRPDGSERHVVMNGSTVRGESGNVTLLVQTFHDVTQLRRLEESQRTLLHIISHDLRSPLAAAYALAQLLVLELRGKRHRDMAERIVGALQRMKRMVGELVDSARLESEQLAPSRCPIELFGFVLTFLRQAEESMDVSRIEVTPPTGPCDVSADPDFLARILSNLVENALKYSTQDSTVTIFLEPSDDAVTLAVRDHGVGIAPTDRPRVFERYYRTSAARTTGQGLGLGLYITRVLTEAQGGTMWVESAVGEGSTFYVRLPAVFTDSEADSG